MSQFVPELFEVWRFWPFTSVMV